MINYEKYSFPLLLVITLPQKHATTVKLDIILSLFVTDQIRQSMKNNYGIHYPHSYKGQCRIWSESQESQNFESPLAVSELNGLLIPGATGCLEEVVCKHKKIGVG